MAAFSFTTRNTNGPRRTFRERARAALSSTAKILHFPVRSRSGAAGAAPVEPRRKWFAVSRPAVSTRELLSLEAQFRKLEASMSGNLSDEIMDEKGVLLADLERFIMAAPFRGARALAVKARIAERYANQFGGPDTLDTIALRAVLDGVYQLAKVEPPAGVHDDPSSAGDDDAEPSADDAGEGQGEAGADQPAPAADDGAVLALAREHAALQAVCDARGKDDDGGPDERDWTRLSDIEEELTATPASGPAALAAKASVLRRMLVAAPERGENGDDIGQLTWSLASDMTRSAGPVELFAKVREGFEAHPELYIIRLPAGIRSVEREGFVTFVRGDIADAADPVFAAVKAHESAKAVYLAAYAVSAGLKPGERGYTTAAKRTKTARNKTLAAWERVCSVHPYTLRGLTRLASYIYQETYEMADAKGNGRALASLPGQDRLWAKCAGAILMATFHHKYEVKVAGAPVPSPDPVFALIRAHEVIGDEIMALQNAMGATAKADENDPALADQSARLQELFDAEAAAADALLASPPSTAAGARALALYGHDGEDVGLPNRILAVLAGLPDPEAGRSDED
jgi:hypothetical protein